jgi:hypothetical protein
MRALIHGPVPVYASQRDKAKDAAVKEGSHIIQDAVVAYAVGHSGAYPASGYVTCTPNDPTADNLGNKYLDTWSRNPRTGKPMVNSGSSVVYSTTSPPSRRAPPSSAGSGRSSTASSCLPRPAAASSSATRPGPTSR